MTLRRASIALMLASALALVIGSAGFSTMAADRGVNVNVVSDDHAYVGYDTEPIEVTTENGTGSKYDENLVTVDNRFTANLDVVSVETGVSTDDITIDVTETPTGIEPGGDSHIEGDIDCNSDDASGTVSMTIRVETTTNSVAAELEGDTETREFVVTCNPQESSNGSLGSSDYSDTRDADHSDTRDADHPNTRDTDHSDIRDSVATVEYNGLGSFEIQSDRTETVEATVWVWNKDSDRRDVVVGTFETNEQISRADLEQKGNIAFTNSGDNNANFDIVAVEFSPQATVNFEATAYIHPQWDGGDFDGSNQGGEGCPVEADIGGTYLEEYEGCDTNDETPTIPEVP
jgi:hypothetical protein